MAHNTAGLIKAIHMGKRKLGMDTETYRQMLRGLTGLDSCSQMTAHELKTVLFHMRQAGFSAQPRKLSPAFTSPAICPSSGWQCPKYLFSYHFAPRSVRRNGTR